MCRPGRLKVATFVSGLMSTLDSSLEVMTVHCETSLVEVSEVDESEKDAVNWNACFSLTDLN